MNSIRVRLLCLVAICLLCVFVTSGCFLYFYINYVLESSFDDALLEKANVFAKTTEQIEDRSLEFEFLEANLPEYLPHDKAEYYQVWSKTGGTVGKSPSLGQGDLPVEVPLRTSPLFQNIALPDGRKGKVVLINFKPFVSESEPIGEYTMALAVSRMELDRARSRVGKGLLLAGLALVLGAFPAVWWSVRHALASLQELGEQANTIQADGLSFRFTSEKSPRELFSIITRLNNLLERLEAAFNRERRFTSAAAHELRIPIAELRTLSEVGVEEAAAIAPEMLGYFQDTLDIAHHLEILVTTLLGLTRCQAGLLKTEIRSMDLAELVRDVWSGYAVRAEQNNLAVTLDVPGHTPIQSDEGLLRAVLANIFSNTVSHTLPGGEVSVTISRQVDTVVLSVRNSCRELQESDLAHLFEAFWRKDESRSSVEHCGIGLALVAAYAQLLGMEVSASLPAVGVFQMVLRCPLIS